MNVCVMHTSGALSLGRNRMLQCANTKHGILMIPALVWLKMVDPSDVIHAARAQAVLQSIFVRKTLLPGQHNGCDNVYLLVVPWTQRTWAVTSLTASEITLPHY